MFSNSFFGAPFPYCTSQIDPPTFLSYISYCPFIFLFCFLGDFLTLSSNSFIFFHLSWFWIFKFLRTLSSSLWSCHFYIILFWFHIFTFFSYRIYSIFEKKIFFFWYYLFSEFLRLCSFLLIFHIWGFPFLFGIWLSVYILEWGNVK